MRLLLGVYFLFPGYCVRLSFGSRSLGRMSRFLWSSDQHGRSLLFFENFVFDVCVCFVLCKCVPGLILWFMDNLWFDDLREE